MGKFNRKPDPSPKVFRRQIERSAAAYTDSKIDELKLLLEDTDVDLVLIDDEDDQNEGGSGGSGGGGNLGYIFPPDEPTPWVIPRPPVRDITQVGEVSSIEFEGAGGEFDYDENSSYGYLYLSADGSLSANVSIKVEGDGDIEDFEVQVTKID